jgi:hypothetical protein
MKPDLRTALLASTAEALRREIDDELQPAEEGAPEEPSGIRIDGVVSGIGAVSRALAKAKAQDDAELLLVPAFGEALPEPSQPQLEALLEPLGPIKNPELAASVARWLSHRPSAAFAPFSTKLNGAVLGAGAEDDLAELLARLWSEMVASEESEQARSALDELARLLREGAAVPPDVARREITETLEQPLDSEAALALRRRSLDRLGVLVRQRFLDSSEAGNLALMSARSMLGNAPAPGTEEASGHLLEVVFGRWAEEAGSREVTATREAVNTSPWVGDREPLAEILVLRLAAARRQGRKRMGAPPYPPDRIAELTAAHPRRFIPGLITWLSFDPPPGEASTALDPLLYPWLPSVLAGPLSEYSLRLGRAGRWRLLAPFVKPSARRPLGLRMLRSLGIERANPKPVTAAIVERFKRAHNNDERKQALLIWKAMAPTDAGVRRELIREVFIPLLSINAGSYDLGRSYLDLCSEPPHGTKGELLAAMDHAPDKQRGRRMAAKAEKLGLASGRWSRRFRRFSR